MGYWVTLFIAAADAFHYQLRFTPLSLVIRSSCSVLVLRDTAMSVLQCLIESARAFPACALFMFLQGMRIKKSPMFDVHTGTESLLIEIPFQKNCLRFWEAINQSSGKNLIENDVFWGVPPTNISTEVRGYNKSKSKPLFMRENKKHTML